MTSSLSSYLFASKHNMHKHTECRGRLPERHKHPSMLAALTTKRYRPNTVVTFFNHNFANCNATCTLIWRLKIYEIKYNISTQMHKKHKKEEKHS